MAAPTLVWRQPVEAGEDTTDPHKLNNDLVVIADKFGSDGTFAPGQPNAAKAGKYMVHMNDVTRAETAAVPASPGPAYPGYSTYTWTDNGHISLNGGVYELLPFSASVKGGTVTYFDFAGTGRSPYPSSYVTYPAPGSDVGGIPLCGTTNYQNVESKYTYSTATMDASPSAGGTYSTAPQPTNASRSGDGTSGSPYVVTQASFRGPTFTSYGGAQNGPSITTYTIDSLGAGDFANGATPAGWSSSPMTTIHEIWTSGGTYQNGTGPTVPHKGSIHFKVVPDTECEIVSGNNQKTVSGTANWANGQGRSVTVTTAADHGLVDANNRIYITGASNNAINGMWNVGAVTNSTQFTTTIFAANCEDGGVDVTGLNIVTYDGIDKSGGILRTASGTVDEIYRTRIGHAYSPGTPASGGTPATPATPAYHTFTYFYDGSHGVSVTGGVTIEGSDYDASGTMTRTSGTRLTYTGAPNGVGNISDGPTLVWEATSRPGNDNADVFAAEGDLTVIAGGMYGNNKVIIKGTVAPINDQKYIFLGSSTSTVVHNDVIFSSTTRPRSMFTDAKLNINADTGRVYTTRSPTTQPLETSVQDAAGFNGVDGGMAPIDEWCPHYMHGRAKAQERNDLEEVLKANTSASDAVDIMLNSPLVDSSDNLVTVMHPRHGFQQTIHFTLQAYKNTQHTQTRTVGTHTADANDYVNRDFYINVHQNMKAAKNDFIVAYPVDSDNNDEVANTDTAMKDLEANTFQSNYAWLADSYSNGTFSNL